MTTIGQNIKRVREFKNYTQEYVADKLGMSIAGYGKIERDETDLPYSRLEQIAQAFNMKVEDLVTFDEKVVFNIMNNSISNDLNVNHYKNGGDIYEKHIKLLEEKIADQYKMIESLKNK